MGDTTTVTDDYGFGFLEQAPALILPTGNDTSWDPSALFDTVTSKLGSFAKTYDQLTASSNQAKLERQKADTALQLGQTQLATQRAVAESQAGIERIRASTQLQLAQRDATAALAPKSALPIGTVVIGLVVLLVVMKFAS